MLRRSSEWYFPVETRSESQDSEVGIEEKEIILKKLFENTRGCVISL